MSGGARAGRRALALSCATLLATATALAAASAASTSVAAPAPPAAVTVVCDGAWHVVPGSRAGGNFARDMLALDATHVYLVDDTSDSMQRWDGTGYVDVPVPSIGAGVVAGTSPGNLYVAGSRQVWHYDGVAWAALPQPSWLSGNATVTDMVAVGTDLWTVSQQTRSRLVQVPTLARWDGSAWTRIPGRISAVSDVDLYAVKISPTGRVTFLGADLVHDPGTGKVVQRVPFVGRVYSGTIRRTDLPQPRQYTAPRSLTWDTNGDLLIGGFTGWDSFYGPRPFLVRGHAGTWTELTHPAFGDPSVNISQLDSVNGTVYGGADSSTQGWFVKVTGPSYQQNGAYHQDTFFVGLQDTPDGGIAYLVGEQNNRLMQNCG